MPILCFDTDGVFYNEKEPHVSGPVKVKDLIPLYLNSDIYIVSESPYYPKDDEGNPIFHIQNDKPERYLNLKASVTEFIKWKGGPPSMKLYISDNGDWREAEKAGFIYVDAKMFANGIKNE